MYDTHRQSTGRDGKNWKEKKVEELKGVQNMALKQESPNERMGRLQERSSGLDGHVERGRGIWGLSLWAHMIGSLISAQLCPSRATVQQTGCQQTQPCFAERWTSPPFLWAHVLSAGEARRASHSEATDTSADGGLGGVHYSTWRRVRFLALGNVFETKQRGPY